MKLDLRGVNGTAPSDWPGKTTDWDHLAVDTATSSGSVTLGSSWTEVVASTSAAYQHIIPLIHGGTDSVFGANIAQLDVGSGASSSEVLKWTYMVETTSVEEIGHVVPPEALVAMFCPWSESSGARLVARCDENEPEAVSFLVAE